MQKLITVLLILGLIAGIGVAGQRLQLEKAFRTVEVAVDLNDLLAGSGIEGLGKVMEQIETWRVDSIVVTADPMKGWTSEELRAAVAAIKEKGYRVLLKVGSGDELHDVKDRRPAGVGLFWENFSVEETAALVSLTEPEVIMLGGDQVAGYPHELAKMASLLKVTGVRFGLQEFAGQLGEAELARSAPLHVVRVHTIYPKELSRYDVENGAARFLRAVKERSYRLLYVRFWPEDPEAGARLLEKLEAGLAAAGYSRGRASGLPPWQSHWSYFFAALGAWAGAGLWLGRLFETSLGKWWKPLYQLGAAAIVLGILALYFFFDQLLARQALAFLAAVTFPALAVMPQRWGKGPLGEGFTFQSGTGSCSHTPFLCLSRGKLVRHSLREFLGSVGITGIGAAVMVAALGDFRFMLKIAEFRGVKAMSILPLLAAVVGAISFARTLGKPMGLKERWRAMPAWAKAVLAAAAVVVVVVYIGRTGNFIIPVPELEVRVREFLEQTLNYRPRTKEFLIGHPLLIVGLGLYFSGDERLGLAFVVPGTIGQISLLNTFAHIHSPLTASVLRSFWGLVLGACLGSVLLYVALLVLGKSNGDH
ncbi:MAG: hypothetical protein GX855_05865 [Firmicutes bacterium]|nr:hypothetical protein [Bacillota bacterium]